MIYLKNNRKILGLMLLYIMKLSCADAQGNHAYKEAAHGVHMADFTVQHGPLTNSINMHIVRVNPKLARVSVVDVRFLSNPQDKKSIQIAFSLREVMRLVSPIATINGGFTRSFVKPIPTGLIISEGKKTSHVVTYSSKVRGMICIKEGGDIVIGEIETIPIGNCISAIQSGPLVVEKNGANGIRDTQQSVKALRSLVGIDGKGWLYLIQTSSASLFDLAEALRPGGTLKMDLVAVLNLDGDIDSGLIGKTKDEVHIFGNIDAVIPSALVVHPSRTSGNRQKQNR